jgi:predicted transcriptional regulator
VSRLEQIKDEVNRLSQADHGALLYWLANALEDELELTEEFKTELKRGEADFAPGRFRIRRPGSAM